MARCLERIRPRLNSERGAEIPTSLYGWSSRLQGGPAPLGKKPGHPSFLKKPRFSPKCPSFVALSALTSLVPKPPAYEPSFYSGICRAAAPAKAKCANSALEKRRHLLARRRVRNQGRSGETPGGHRFPIFAARPLRAWLPTPLPARGHQSGLLAPPQAGTPPGAGGIGAGLRVLGRPHASGAAVGDCGCARLPSSADFMVPPAGAEGPKVSPLPPTATGGPSGNLEGTGKLVLGIHAAAAAAAASRRRSGRSGRLALPPGVGSPAKGPLSPGRRAPARAQLSPRAPEKCGGRVCSRVAEPGCGPGSPAGWRWPGLGGVRPCPGPRARPPSPAR